MKYRLQARAAGLTIFDEIAKDKEIVKTVLLLTGSFEGAKRQVYEYLETFLQYEWLWKDNKAIEYDKFIRKKPSLEDFDVELKKYVTIELHIQRIAPVHNIGALSLETAPLKYSLKSEASSWKSQYSENLHNQAKTELEAVIQWMDDMQKKLKREVLDLDNVRATMGYLKEIREKGACRAAPPPLLVLTSLALPCLEASFQQSCLPTSPPKLLTPFAPLLNLPSFTPHVYLLAPLSIPSSHFPMCHPEPVLTSQRLSQTLPTVPAKTSLFQISLSTSHTRFPLCLLKEPHSDPSAHLSDRGADRAALRACRGDVRDAKSLRGESGQRGAGKGVRAAIRVEEAQEAI